MSDDIVVVIGMKGPFDRLIAAVAAWQAAAPRRRAWVQHGESPLPAGLDGAPVVPRNELLSRMKNASAVVVHGGSGAIRDARGCGHAPVVVARRSAFGEHVNDHQTELVAALAAQVVPCPNPESLAALTDAIARAAARRRPEGIELPGAELRAAVARRLSIAAGQPAPRARWVWDVLALATRGIRPRRRGASQSQGH